MGSFVGKNPITNLNERLLGTIKQTGIKHTVLGKEYQNVIQTELIFQNEIMGFWIPITTFKYYVARGIGIIEKEASFGEGPTAIVTKQVLKSYSIAN